MHQKNNTEYSIVDGGSRNTGGCSSTLTVHRYKLVTTSIFFVVWITLGIVTCVIGSTLPDFRLRVGISNEEFGRLMLVVVVIAAALSIGGGILADRCQRHVILILAAVQLIIALGHGLIPWSVNVYMAGAMFVIRDSALRACNALGSAYIVAMWGEDASFYIHLLHMGYPAGCMLGPVIAGPFLSNNQHACDGSPVSSCANATGNCTNIVYGTTSAIGGDISANTDAEVTQSAKSSIIIK